MSFHGTRSSVCMLAAVPKHAEELHVLSLLHIQLLCNVSSQKAKE